MKTNSYQAAPLDVDEDQTLLQVERGMPVRLIATFEGLTTTTPDEPAISASNNANAHRFDYLPVRQSENGPIIGIFSSSMSQSIGANHNVEQVYDRLGPDDLISAETSLLQFVWSAEEQPRRLVLEGTDIRGIVTLSDIQKLPVRISLFSLFIHFELLLTEHLRHILRDRSPIEFVSPGRRGLVQEKWHEFTSNQMEQDIFSAMDICDKRDVAKKLNILGKSATSIQNSITGIERDLRNPIAHGSDYAISREAAVKAIRAARATRDWIADLRKARRIA